jgi:trehalose 6-phosphate phosphatase
MFASGRSLEDLEARVKVRGAAYIGNHGLEAEDGAWRWVHPAATRARPAVRKLARSLAPVVGSTPGASLENKGLSLSLHFRHVRSKAAVRRLEKTVAERVAGADGPLRILHGKKVWNIKPDFGWNKGEGLLRWRKARKLRGTLVFVGDDRTDEEGFRALGRRAVSVKIGPGATCAAYRLSQKDVRRLLAGLLQRKTAS